MGRTTDELAAFVIDMSPILRHDALLVALDTVSAHGYGGVDTTGSGQVDAHADDGTEAHKVLRDIFMRNSNCAPHVAMMLKQQQQQQNQQNQQQNQQQQQHTDDSSTADSKRRAVAKAAAAARRDPRQLFDEEAAAIAATRMSATKLKQLIESQGLFHAEMHNGDPQRHRHRVMAAIDGYVRHQGDPTVQHHYKAAAAAHE